MASRDRSKADYWRRMIRRQAASGLSVRAWCGRHDLAEASFYWWRRQLGRRDAMAHAPRSGRISRAQFVPARCAADASVLRTSRSVKYGVF